MPRIAAIIQSVEPILGGWVQPDSEVERALLSICVRSQHYRQSFNEWRSPTQQRYQCRIDLYPTWSAAVVLDRDVRRGGPLWGGWFLVDDHRKNQ